MERRQNEKKVEIKKIVMLFSMSFLPYQGRYLRVYNEAKTLVEAGKEVTVIAWDRDCRSPKKEVIDNIKIERIWSRAGFQSGPLGIFRFLAFYLRLFPRLIRSQYDVIHCFNLDTIFPGLLIARIRGKKAILDLCEPNYYSNWPRKYILLAKILQFFERILSKRFDYLLLHSYYQVRKFQSYGVGALEHIGSYPNHSLIIDKIKGQIDTDGAVVIGRIGSIYKDNGIEEMIDVFKRLKAAFTNVKLLIAGKVFDEFRDELNRLIFPLGDAIEVIGEFSPEDLIGLYGKLDISFQLSRRTDWFKDITPTKFFESLASGVPVITSDIGDLREIVKQYNCGVIVDETDPESIFLGLKRLVEDPGLRLKIAENGLRAVRDSFNWDLMGQRLLGVYRLLNSSGVLNNSAPLPEAREC